MNEQNKDARMWGMLAHLSALLVCFGIPTFVGPLVVWLIKKNEFAFVDAQGKEALNFQISMTIYMAVAGLLCLILIGIPLLILLGLADVIFSIVAAVKANDGADYQYPMTIRLIK